MGAERTTEVMGMANRTDPQGHDVGPPTAFSRKASGLIRVASGTDVFIFNIGLVSIGIAIALNQYYGPSFYPGAAIPISTMLAVLGMVFVAITFYHWSTVFPRSGGVYVSLSRTVSPGTGFVLSVVETVILLYYAALAASLIVTVGLSSFFAILGSLIGSDLLISWATFTAGANGIFWVGSAVLVLAGLLLTWGTRKYFTVQRVLFAVAILGTLILALVMAFGSRSVFEANFADLTGLSPAAVIDTARASGLETSPFDWGNTLRFLVWPLLPLLGAVQSIGIGGEVKQVKRNQQNGMIGAVVVAGLVIALFAFLASRTFGEEFQAAIAWNSINGAVDASTEASLGAAPWFTVLAGVLANNVVLAFIILFTFVAWIWFWIPAEIAYTTRSMIAWSFDRVAPERLGYVSERLHTPVVAIWLSTAMSIVFMWLIAYRNIALLTLIEAILVIWGVALASAIVFPRTRPELFRSSAASSSRLGGQPTMTITGTFGLAFFAYCFYALWTDPIAAGPMVSSAGITLEFWLSVGVVAVATAWYLVIKRLRRSQGIDIELAYRQIPIE